MFVIAALTIVSFIFLYNTSQLDNLASMKNPSIYGESLSPGAIERQAKNYQLTRSLGQFELLMKLGGAGADQEASVSEFVWNLLVLKHQSRVFGIEPTDEQVASRIKSLPPFQTSGQFDPTKYGAFLREQLAPRGFNERQLEDVMRDALRLERVSAAVESPITVGAAEVRDAAKVMQPVTASFVRFDAAAAAAAVQISPTEISAVFEQNRATFNSPEMRNVRFVAFELPQGTKLEGKAKIEALQKLANAASAFAESIGGKAGALQAAAGTAGLAVRTTPAFDRSGSLPSAAKADDDTAKQTASIVSAIAPAAFLLNGPGKASDVIQGGDAFYVVELAELTPSRPLTLAEATPWITSRLRQEAAAKGLRDTAATQIKAMREAVAAGKSFADAATQSELKAENLANVVPMSESTTPEQRRIIAATLSLRDGEISNFENAPWGGFAVYLKTRGPLDDKEFAAKKEEIQNGLMQNKQELLFAEWLRVSRSEAKISIPRAGRR